jgi:hypothetical protein
VEASGRNATEEKLRRVSAAFHHSLVYASEGGDLEMKWSARIIGAALALA